MADKQKGRKFTRDEVIEQVLVCGVAELTESEEVQRFRGALSNLAKESGLDSDFFCFSWFESPYAHFEAG